MKVTERGEIIVCVINSVFYSIAIALVIDVVVPPPPLRLESVCTPIIEHI